MLRFFALLILSVIMVGLIGCASKVEPPPVEVETPEPEKPQVFVEVITESAPLYGIPGNETTRANALPQGTLLEVTAEQTGWYEVTLPDSSTGWVQQEIVAVPAAHDTGQNQWRPLTGHSNLQVGVDWLNVRTEGSITAEIVESIMKGTRLTVMDKKGAWYWVKLPDRTEGWVYEALVEPYQGGDPTIGQHFKTRGDTPMYSGAGTDHEKVQTVWALKPVIKINQQNEWYEVQLKDGTTGWIHKDELKKLQ